MLICPYCGANLARIDGTFCCAEGHSFDVAREGYVNLTVGRHPGDTKAMLRARRAFLDAGYYAPLAAAINEQIGAYLRQCAGQAVALLDVGCGEGFYSGQLAAHLAWNPLAADAKVRLFGLDIARDGVRMAAKRYPEVAFVVANLKAGLPLRTASLTALLNVFAPRHPAEFARVLAADGLLLVVIPQPDHLAELRARLPLLKVEEQKREHVLSQFTGEFALLEATDLRFQMALTAAAVRHLVMMTPTHHRDAALTQEIVQGSTMPERVTAAFTLLALVRT